MSRWIDRALQIARFGIVGGGATAVHAAVYSLTVAGHHLSPITANVAGFACAFVVSWLGHHHWTFGGPARAAASTSAARFFVVALCGLASNEALTALFVYGFGWPAQTGLVAIIGITPLLVFLGSKYWAFAETAPTLRRDGTGGSP